MKTLATYIYPNGKEITVEVIKTDRASHTAVVADVNWIGTGNGWDFRPELFVDQCSLVDVHTVGEPEPVTDDQDASDTQAELLAEFGGR